MRPAKKASRPATTACFMASAIEHRISRSGDAGVHQQRVDAKLHRYRGIGGRSHARINDDRHAGAFFDDANRVRIADAQSAADRRGQRHDGRTTQLFELTACDRIVADVGQHGESVGNERFGGRERLARIGMKRLRVADYLELDEIGAEKFAGQLCGQNCILGRVASRRVRQNMIAVAIDIVEQGLAFGVVEADAPDRDRDHLGSAGRVGGLHHLDRGILSRADDQPRAELVLPNFQTIAIW